MTSFLNKSEEPVYTLADGQPVHDPSTSLQIRSRYGGGGLALLQDTQLIETLAHFSRERIPERVVHAKAAGAWGEFEVTKDISNITSAKFLSEVGKKTKVLARISTVGGEKGSADTVSDIRGFALKMFTDEGNWDFVGNDLPVFFIRDPVKFPSMNRTHKRHPQTNVPDANMFWDFHVNNQEGVHTLMQLFGGRGIPASVRHVNGFGNHTFKFGKTNPPDADGSFVYVKIHFKPKDGVKNLDPQEALRLAGIDPDYHVVDLFNAIERGEYPVWTMYIQTMTPEQAEKAGGIVFDITKVWPHEQYPLQEVGRLTLNKNPDNFFAEIEQAAFSPSAMPPGIAPSADIMLQARMFSYPDAQRYRLGANYQQLPCNKPLSTVYSPYQRDGAGSINGNYGPDPDYTRSTFRSIKSGPADIRHDEWAGRIQNYTSEVTDEDFDQPRKLWALLKEQGVDNNLVVALAGHMGKAIERLQKEAIAMFAKVDKELGERIAKELQEHDKKHTANVHDTKQK